MTLYHVADYLNCHYTTAHRLAQRGVLAVFRLGSDYRIRRADLEDWMAQQRAVSVEKAPLTDSEPKAAKPLAEQRVVRKPKSRR